MVEPRRSRESRENGVLKKSSNDTSTKKYLETHLNTKRNLLILLNKFNDLNKMWLKTIKNFKIISFFLLITIIFLGCSPKENNELLFDSSIIEQLNKKNVQIKNLEKTIDITLPKDFSEANWELKKTICSIGGYNLTNFSGKEVKLYSFLSNKYHGDNQLNVWIITNKNNKEIICAYFSVKSSSGLTPGIFSINDSSIDSK